MLYDDIQQLEVRYVISLEYHDVDVYSGGDSIPEGELWIKRNAIRLRRKKSTIPGDQGTSPPFFLFSENISEKEDFYFALLNNQTKGREDSPPEPQLFETKDIVTLVQKLHSSGENLQSRWLNAVIGRLFLAMYKTPEMEAFVRKKLTKKISRVKKPNFITKLALQKIELGDGGPFITTPRLKDLTVDGDCTVEADVLYTGNFRIEIAATARIELGSRFKAREVDLLLAVTCKKLEGHGLLRFKPPPSNRVWYTFEKMPKIDLHIEPIVSSRQITYTVILRAIESRIREVIAETIVLPFWDDAPFLDTSQERFRGGIWKRESAVPTSTEIRTEDPEDEAEASIDRTTPPEPIKLLEERTMSMPVLDGSNDAKQRSGKRSVISLADDLGTSTSIEKSPRAEAPHLMRSSSFATATNPKVTANHADADSIRSDVYSPQKRDNASSILKDLSSRSQTASPGESPAGTPPKESTLAAAMEDRGSANTTQVSVQNPTAGQGLQSSVQNGDTNQDFVSAASTSREAPSTDEDQAPKKGIISVAKSLTATDRKQALASINAATAAAQKWGWGVLHNKRQKEAQASEPTESPAAPMGRGRPLPPPGTPLPPPERSSPMLNFSIPKRKPVPPPPLPKRSDTGGTNIDRPTSSPKPPLPERRRRHSSMRNDSDPGEDEVYVVAAPTESAPATPVTEEHRDEFFGHTEASLENPPIAQTDEKPDLPPRYSDIEVEDHATTKELSSAEQDKPDSDTV